MGVKKQYADPSNYEAKLERVMERFGATEYNYDFSRHGAWVEFWLDGQLYRFDHSVEKAKAHGINVVYGSDVFAQIVLSLEDLARMAERGIYKISTWLVGMRFLPPPIEIPPYFKALGFENIPADAEDVKTRFKLLAKQLHPDAGGSDEGFIGLQEDARKAIEYLESEAGKEQSK